MKRAIAVAVAALVPGLALGQMMGGSMSTSGYFPLVDGARYEYVHAGGAWASSSVTVRGGQSWAGHADLVAMHTTYVCAAGQSCAPDATDFYRGLDDGVRYYGGTGADPTGTHFSMMALGSPEWILRNPVQPRSGMGGPGQGGDGSWWATVQGTDSMMGIRSHTSTYTALDVGPVTTPAGTFADALHVREQRGAGVEREAWYAPGVGMVRMTEGAQVTMLSGYTIPGPAAQPGGGAAPMPFMPFNGLWWNPEESGTGVNVQVQRGVMVATMFSYLPSGEPVWYYAAGPLRREGEQVAVTASLDHYRGGQCVTCPYTLPAVAGSDGAFSITFTGPSSATMRLPGGRTTRIQPQGW
ncbi:MAG: hypothetical protein IPH30_00850 [Betaproteobacteria bacterium]|nr:hypothetical protein [Betaproteobacteria bacterium]